MEKPVWGPEYALTEDYAKALDAYADTLAAQLAEAKGEMSVARNEIIEVQEELEASQAEVARLREAMKKYSEHCYPCQCLPSLGSADDQDCTCGLTEALNQTKE